MIAVPAAVRTWDPPGPPLYTALVSRTVQSTDLFGPYRQPKETIHSIAEYQQAVPPLGGKYWGEKLTEYGGIGGYPFHGQQRVRDLFVSRSHRHFGTGVTKSVTYDQPYQVTDLNKSGCRINDERLSAPMKTKLNTFPLQKGDWPGNHPYYSHKSIFEVFPEVKPKPETDSMSDGRSSYSTTTTNSYDDALRRLHHKLYHTSLYQQSYKGHFHQPSNQQPNGTAPITSGLDSIQLSRKREDEMVMMMPMKRENGGLKGGNREEVEKGDESEQTKQREEEGEEEEGKEEDEDNNEEKDVAGDDETFSQGGSSELRSILVSDAGRSANTTRAKSQSTTAKRSVSFSDTPQVQILESHDPAKDREETKGSDVSSAVEFPPSLPGTGPCWPPSTSLVIENIRGSQLLERRDITYAPAPSIGRTDLLKKLLSSSKIGEHITYVPRPPLGVKASKLPSVPLPSSLKSGSSALASLQSASDRGCQSLAGDAVHFPSGAEGFLQPGDSAQLYPKQQNQPFVVPPSYRMHPMKYSGMLGSLPGRRRHSDPVRKLQDELAKRISIRKGATPLVLPPAPLSECLTPSGSKTPHRLGLRYKTEAHKRYHTIYPEQTPDLRSTRHSGRKCFFEGDHSSVFRG